ncbi:MAG: O-antigen polymerase [Terriglobia bacterium]
MVGLLAIITMLSVSILLGIVPSISLLTVLLSGAAAGFVLLQTGRGYDLLHPVRVFGFIWCFCLALASLRLVTVLSVWSFEMWVYVFGALICFTVGFWVASRHLARVWGLPKGRVAQEFPTVELLPTGRTLLVALICLVLGIVSLAYQYRAIGEIPVLARDINEARTTFMATASQWRHPEFDTLFNKFVILFGVFCKYAAFLGTIVLIQKTRKTRFQQIVAWSVTIFGLMGYGSLGGRGFLFEYMVFSLVIFHYLRRRIRLKEMIVASVLLLLFISFAGYYRTAVGDPTAAYDRAKRISKFPEGQFWDSIAFGYFSATCPLEVFYRLTQDLPALRRPSAGFLFYSLHRFVPRENIEELAALLYTGEMITPTFLGEFYGDFGAMGVFLGPLILGICYGYVYCRAKRYRSLYWLCVQGIMVQNLAYFPHVNFFSQNVNWMWDLMNLALLTWVARRGILSDFSMHRQHGMGRVAPVLGRSR